jgi:selenocysteine lyase/cysteine desulfurase
VITRRKRDPNPRIYNHLIDQEVHISMREGNLRFSPHLYNTHDEVERILSLLNSFQ